VAIASDHFPNKSRRGMSEVQARFSSFTSYRNGSCLVPTQHDFSEEYTL
jgi:hypothetical protein